MKDWIRVKEAGANLMVWWDSMLKIGVKYLAVQRAKEIEKQRLRVLNMLKLKQAFLTSQVQGNVPNYLTELSVINGLISNWYNSESEKISQKSGQKTWVSMRKVASSTIVSIINSENGHPSLSSTPPKARHRSLRMRTGA